MSVIGEGKGEFQKGQRTICNRPHGRKVPTFENDMLYCKEALFEGDTALQEAFTKGKGTPEKFAHRVFTKYTISQRCLAEHVYGRDEFRQMKAEAFTHHIISLIAEVRAGGWPNKKLTVSSPTFRKHPEINDSETFMFVTGYTLE